MPYLLKTEPSEYSFAQLKKDKATLWDGVTNPVAVKNLRGMKPGDELIIYHTGNEKQTVGTATVVSVDGSSVKIKAGSEINPTTLAEIKANPLFAESALVRQGRLSVVPLNHAQYRALAKRK